MAINECLKSLDAKDPATAVVAFVLINRFPGSETNTDLAETSAPWVEQKSSKVASNAQGAPHQSKVAGIFRDPETRLEVSRAPTGDKYIHYHAHVPQKNAKGKIIGYRRVHLFSEQVKTSSAFGNSSPRHNIQPPVK
jgi:hypothetical protein